MERVNINGDLNYCHKALFKSIAPELCVRGGANAGKSYSIADKILLAPRHQPKVKLKALVLRKTFPSLRSSVIDIFKRRAEIHRMNFHLNEHKHSAQCENLELIFKSLNNKDDYIAVKSMTDIDFVWANEITELRELDYDILRMRIRGGKSYYSQFMYDFNPVGKTSWVFNRLFANGANNGKVQKLHYTVNDNPWASPEEIEKLKELKEIDENLWKIYCQGEWGELEGVIFNWDIVPLPKKRFDEIFYGLDFGYTVDPAAVIRIYRKANEFWLEEIIYETGLTNIQLGNLMKTRGMKKKSESIYADSAEPKSIQELCDMGWNVYPAEKGPDSVRAGIDYLKTVKVHIVEGSENIAKEQKSYIWKKDKDGNPLNVPIDFNNHAMDAARYGIYTNSKIVIPHAWSPQ